MSKQTSIFQLINATKNVVSVLEEKSSKKHYAYVYKGKSKNGVLQIALNSKMNLQDFYELEICGLKYSSTNPISISCNCVQIYNTHNDSSYSMIFASDSFTDIRSDLIFDVKQPVPNPLVFIGEVDFELLIKLRDK